MQVEKTALPGVLKITPRRFGDARGWFTESWNGPAFDAATGTTIEWVQDNHSFSAQKGTVRGLHYQSPPRAQDKLVRVTQGAVRDVAVDARRGSPSYGRWVAVDLTAEGGEQLLIPKGFLHGFATLTPDVHFLYKCSDVYAPDCDGAVAWDDADLGIDWGVEDATVSAKDAAAPRFSDWTSPFAHEDFR